MPPSSVLRIGPVPAAPGDAPACAASVLRSVLLSHFRAAPPNDGGSSNVLPILNKYFSAEVAIEYLTGGQGEEAAATTATAAGCPSAEAGMKEDGIILVFTAGGGSHSNGASVSAPAVSFDSMESVHDAALAAGECGDLLRLCVGASLDGPVPPSDGRAAEEEYSRRVLWCLDRGYEYVEADLSDSGVRSGHDEREREGFARVAEAVASTVWSGASMRPRGAARPGGAATASLPSPGTEGAELDGGGPAEDGGAGAKGAANVGALGDAESETKVGELLGADPQQGARDEEAESDALFKDLDNVIQQAVAARTAAKSGELSDEDRRKRAGDVAMMLAGLLGNMDFDESDEDGDEVTSSDEEDRT